MEKLAHIYNGKTQTLKEHLINVSNLAAKFSENFDNSDCARLLGFYHDVGKADERWQNYLKRESGYDITIPAEQCFKGNHTAAGAIKIATDPNLDIHERVSLAYAALGHHKGLPNYNGGENDLRSVLKLYEKFKNLDLSDIQNLNKIVSSEKYLNMKPEYKNLWVRFMAAVLIDSDRLDTESVSNPEAGSLRGSQITINELKGWFEDYMKEKRLSSPKTEINDIRNEVYQQAIEAAELEPGFYSLSGPTGCGKTLAALAFALTHAVKHEMERIITVLPFNTITEQTARIYKYGTDDDKKIEELKKLGKHLFGDENVLENHCNVDPNTKTDKEELDAQNWDSPFVVTTTVQLFESALAAKASPIRKDHNMSNSVIILDEAQALPVRDLRAILSVLNYLVDCCHSTVLICTATQPAIVGEIGTDKNKINGLSNCTEIIKDPEKLFKDLKRVNYFIYNNDIWSRPSWKEIASELVKYEQVLCIVNTRRDCRSLMEYMPDDTIQLSKLMCNSEVGNLISKIKRSLKEGKPIRVVSTSLIEAGVDIDFPVVWRAMTKLDSIVQGAGRANREGLLKDLGKVVVFTPDVPTFGEVKIGADITSTFIAEDPDFLNKLTPKSFERYFRFFYGKFPTLDYSKYDELLVKGADMGIFQFADFDKNFKMIDTAGQSTVFVPFEDGKRLVEKLKSGKMNRKLLASLERYSVNLPNTTVEQLQRKGGVAVVNGYYVLNENYYERGKGVIY